MTSLKSPVESWIDTWDPVCRRPVNHYGACQSSHEGEC